ncbi:MAG: ErfK/YbiS/YcfS/YnhG family protein [Pseudomonadota bacterium]|nr:ErfK/YbiS/YcfS/YnhG family protein [Pseudomonadota bacterium]
MLQRLFIILICGLPVTVCAVHPEQRLLSALQSVQQGQMQQAESQLQSLLHDEPQFRAANLLYADVLKARSQPLQQPGMGITQSEELKNLLSEIRLRWQAQGEDVTVNKIPSALGRLDENYQHAIVVDLKRSRLYVFANHDGQPQRVADYFISMGRAGADKTRQGDLRTPLGVYFVQSYMPDAELEDKYGVAAYPLNYPNVWDARRGRTGHGIWLHGTDSGTYNRPPLASEGCVVLPNSDLLAVSQYIALGQTPVIIGNGLEWLDANQWQMHQQTITASFDQWLHDWRSLDVKNYLQHYSQSFNDGSKNFRQWSEHKQRVAQGKTHIDVSAKYVSLLLHPNEQIMVATFLQDYNSNNFSSQTWKRQYWQKESDGRWRIIHEGEATPQITATRLAKSTVVEVQQAN